MINVQKEWMGHAYRVSLEYLLAEQSGNGMAVSNQTGDIGR